MNCNPIIEFQGVSKTFGDVVANSEVSFSVSAGTIHGIIGENGAGKSTAMNILFGLYLADQGKVLIKGKSVRFQSSIDAMNEKIGMVHQHFMLAEPLTALDNILLYQKGSAFSILKRNEQKVHLEAIAKRFGFEIDFDAKISELSVGAQQRLEILKILSQDSEILILDEPTAVLTPQEVQDLFCNLRKLKSEGKTILIITHKLKEVMSLTDSVTVFRAGKVISTKVTSESNLAELAELMVGTRLVPPQERSTRVDNSHAVLKVSSLNAQMNSSKIHDIDFQVHGKEIVGIAGVEGNGQDILVRSLIDKQGLNKKNFRGEVSVSGTMVSFPEDRLRFGCLPSRPVWENFFLGQQSLAQFNWGPFIRKTEILKSTKLAIQNYDIRPTNEFLPFEKLSGGNQQKLVVARALSQNPQFILAAQPTRGVDIGAIQFIHNELRAARDHGAGILLISSELDELMTLSDRILVLYKGRFIAEFHRDNFNEITIGAAMGGVEVKPQNMESL